MAILITFAFLSIASLGGVFFLAGRQIVALRRLSEKEQELKMSGLPPFFDFIRNDVIRPFEAFVSDEVRPELLKTGEKVLRRFRLVVLKTEALLQRLSDYFHGKRIAIKNGSPRFGEAGSGNGNGKNSEFWNEMNEAKNGLQKDKSKSNNSLDNNLPA